METLIQEVRKIFNSAQDGVVVSKLCEMLLPIQDKSDPDEFWDVFLSHLQKTMIYYKAEIVVERVMVFCAVFVTHSSMLKAKKREETNASIEDENSEEKEEEMDPFLLNTFNFIIKNHNSRDKGVRYRCCQLINKLFTHMGDEDTIDEDLSNSIYECMMIRLKDKVPLVRIQAVLALVRLQDPEDEECAIIDAFLHSIETDTNADVRKTILSNIALSRKTLPAVLGRIRDVKEQNRKAAYLTLAEKVSIRALTIAQRINVLNVGLNDRSEVIKQACGQLLKTWLRSYDCDVIKLLSALDTESTPECTVLVLETLFKGISVEKVKDHVSALLALTIASENEVKMLQHESLTPENVVYWYTICKHLKSLEEEGEALLQKVLPELTNFCVYIQSYAEKYFIDSAILTAFEGKEGQPEFILEQLLNIAGLLDFSDEVGRKNLQKLVHDLLVIENVPLSLSSVLVTRYADVENNEDKFVQAIVEAIADVRQPLIQVITTAMKDQNRRNELQVARLRVKLMECKEELDTCLQNQDYQQAALLKDQIAELEEQRNHFLEELSNKDQMLQRVEKDDPETMLKCLTIASSILIQIKKIGLSSTLMALKEDLIFEGVKNEDPYVRNEAVKCLGHLSLLNKEFAAQHLVLFLQVAQVDQELLQITAVQIIFDLFLIYGFEAFETAAAKGEEDEELKDNDEIVDSERTVVEDTPPEEVDNDRKTHSNAAESMLGILVMFLESESADLRTAVAEGMAKLLISGRIVSTKILTRLILLWYNPITEDDIKLRHCLGVFLPAFAFENRTNQELIEESFIPVLRTLLNAPSTSPLSQINISNVIDLLIQLTDIRNLVEYTQATDVKPICETHIHDSIAIKVCNEILSDPEDADTKLLCRTLNQLHICPKNILAINDLHEHSVQIIEALGQNRLAKKMIEKFQLMLQSMMTNLENVDKEDTITNMKEQEDDNDEDQNDDNTDATDSEINTTLTSDIGALALQKQLNESLPTGSAIKHKLSVSSEGNITSPKKLRRSSSISPKKRLNLSHAR